MQARMQTHIQGHLFSSSFRFTISSLRLYLYVNTTCLAYTYGNCYFSVISYLYVSIKRMQSPSRSNIRIKKTHQNVRASICQRPLSSIHVQSFTATEKLITGYRIIEHSQGNHSLQHMCYSCCCCPVQETVDAMFITRFLLAWTLFPTLHTLNFSNILY